MKIKRDALVQHLNKISCGGQVEGAVFTGAFQTTALTEDHLLLVLAPGLSRVEPLPEDIGVPELAKLVRSLGVIAGQGNEGVDVNVRLEDHRLIIDEDHRGVLKLMVASPKTIGTNIEPTTVEKLMAKAPEEDGIPLTRALIEGVKDTFSLYKAAEVELFVGPDGGRIKVGNENSDMAEFASEDLKAETEYSLLFGEHLVDVLSVVTNYSEAELRLGGPNAFALIKDGPYQYLLSPRSKGADAAPEKKAEVAEAEATAAS